MLRTGVTLKQIENKHVQNWLIFRVWIIWGTQKNWGALPPNAPRGYGPGLKYLIFTREEKSKKLKCLPNLGVKKMGSHQNHLCVT